MGLRQLKALDDAGELKDYYMQLEDMVQTEIRRMTTVLNDTKNYGSRLSADIVNGTIHVFAEEYNYRIPEANELLSVFEMNKWIISISVFRGSAFMRQISRSARI
jgi:hypothetical protein